VRERERVLAHGAQSPEEEEEEDALVQSNSKAKTFSTHIKTEMLLSERLYRVGIPGH
jgi:hypothetical protein